MEAPKRAVKFAANGWWGNVFTNNGKKKTTQPIAMLTGMAAGATESFLVTPFELVKIRMQDKNSTYKGPMDVVKKVIAQKGPLGIYQGMEPTFWRHVWWNGGYFGSIFQVKSLLPKAEVSNVHAAHSAQSNRSAAQAGACAAHGSECAVNSHFAEEASRVRSIS